MTEERTYNFSTFDEWWEAQGKYNAARLMLSANVKELMRLAWGVAREQHTSEKFTEPGANI